MFWMKQAFILLIGFSLVFTQQKHAIVIGINDYETEPLRMCVNDANAMSSILDEMGYNVTTLLDSDATHQNIRNALYRLDDENNFNENDIVLFYFSGHGSEENGKHYLIPTDLSSMDSRDLAYEGVLVERVQEMLEITGAGTRVMILDACRFDYNKVRHGAGYKALKGKTINYEPAKLGLKGTIIAYAAAPNTMSLELPGYNNGVYTHFLIQEMIEPNIKIEDILKKVRRLVVDATEGEQVPWETSSLISDFYFTTKNIEIDIPVDQISSISECVPYSYYEIQEDADLLAIENIIGEKITPNCLCDNCIGVQKMSDRSLYVGSFKSGLLDGRGVFLNIGQDGRTAAIQTEEIYIGKFQDGKIDGEGLFIVPLHSYQFYVNLDSLKTEGLSTIIDAIDKYSGYGSFIYPVIGTAYVGEFLDGAPSKGEIYVGATFDSEGVKGGEVYFSGDFVESEPQCSPGCYDSENFDNRVSVNCYSGYATRIYDDCSQYTGSFKSGKRHGSGVYVDSWATISIESDNWYEGETDFASIEYANGDRYLGYIKYRSGTDVRLSGKGVYNHFVDHGIYDQTIGHYEDGTYHGRIHFILSSGEEYYKNYQYGVEIPRHQWDDWIDDVCMSDETVTIDLCNCSAELMSAIFPSVEDMMEWGNKDPANRTEKDVELGKFIMMHAGKCYFESSDIEDFIVEDEWTQEQRDIAMKDCLDDEDNIYLNQEPYTVCDCIVSTLARLLPFKEYYKFDEYMEADELPNHISEKEYNMFMKVSMVAIFDCLDFEDIGNLIEAAMYEENQSIDICRCLSEPGNTDWAKETRYICRDAISAELGVENWEEVSLDPKVSAGFDRLVKECGY